MNYKAILLFLLTITLFFSFPADARRIQSISPNIRLSAEDVFVLYENFSAKLDSALEDLQISIRDGLNILQEEGVEAFRSKSWPNILNRLSELSQISDDFKTIAPRLGFADQNVQIAVNDVLGSIAGRFNADKIAIIGDNFLSYSWGFTPSEAAEFAVNAVISIALSCYSWNREDLESSPLEQINRIGIFSFVTVGKDREIPIESDLSFVIGRSQELVDRFGSFSEEEITQIEDFFRENISGMVATIMGNISEQELEILGRLMVVRDDLLVNGVDTASYLWRLNMEIDLASEDLSELQENLRFLDKFIDRYRLLNVTYAELIQEAKHLLK